MEPYRDFCRSIYKTLDYINSYLEKSQTVADIIKLLPDSVANQIAAGEVIQRPSSVVKELMENAIDAGATDIKVVIKDAGSTLIQIIDNGCGMSEIDARMAFERHATSKISDAKDLFKLHTNGFRGEALASIAAVAQVELKTKRQGDELGTQILISGSELEKQESTVCTDGTNLMIKNLFYNVPARRRFLKKNEFTYIDGDFKRIALTYPDISMSLTHNTNIVYHLPSSNLRQRIVNLFGKHINSKLISIKSETSIVNISGFVGTPESAKKSRGEQYFFVNGRYMKHPYFNRSVIDAYGRLLPADTYASYFIFFEVDPQSIDVNVHPQKVEIKFENERAIYPILMATVKEAIGKFSLSTQIDFDQENAPEIPTLSPETKVSVPKISINTSFNPFATQEQAPQTTRGEWKNPYEIARNENFLTDTEEETQQTLDLSPSEETVLSDHAIQFFRKYIAIESDNGVLFIHQHRAHERILYEDIKKKIAGRSMNSQKLIFPESMQFDSQLAECLREIQPLLTNSGFDIEDAGEGKFLLNALPAEIASLDGISIIEQVLEMAELIDIDEEINTIIIEILARQGAIKQGQELSNDEMLHLAKRLLKCDTPLYSPRGKKTMSVLTENEISTL